jgi:hypothetical protein
VDKLKISVSNMNANISPMPCSQCLGTRFAVLSYVCHMLVHTFTFCNKVCCEHLTLNKVILKKITLYKNRKFLVRFGSHGSATKITPSGT